MNRFHAKPQGFTLLELIVAVALFMIFSAGLAGTAISGYLTSLENARMVKANGIFSETWEAVRAIRNNHWADLSNGAHGLSSAGGHWSFSGSSDTYNGFTRVITVEDVLRDDDGNIVDSGADADPDTKRLTLELTWESVNAQTRSLTVNSYLTNYPSPSEWPVPPPEPPLEP